MLKTLPVRIACWATRNFHGLPGRWRLVRWVHDQRDALATMPAMTVRLADTYRMQVRPEDENGRYVYVNGFDPTERIARQFVRVLQPGDHAIDVGANIGYFALLAARVVGDTGTVHAFEASPHVLPTLRTNAELNPEARLFVHGKAVTDGPGEIEFHTAPADRRGYSSIRDLGDATAHTTRVPTTALDSMLDRFQPIRLVKIDVEGAELLVLRGMSELIARDQPVIVFELDDGFLRQLGASAQQVCDFLSERGYALRRIVAAGDLEPFTEPPTQRCNIFAAPQDEMARYDEDA